MRFRRGLIMGWEGDPRAPAWSRALAGGLAPLGALYGAAMARRRRRFEAGKRRVRKTPVPVMSVGNLTLGGTGKTPLVARVAEKLLAAGRRPAVVSRGYGGRPKDVMVVGDAKGGRMESPPAADEAAMLARRYPDLLVLTGADRAFVAGKAAEEFGADVIVIDDGFQHLGLAREMDVALVRGERPFGNGRVTPAGMLREPPSALARADAILVTGGEAVDGGDAAMREVRRHAPNAPLFTGGLVPDALLDARGERVGAPESLAGAQVVAVSGIANPASFARTLASLGAEMLAHHEYPDHANYAMADGVRLISSFRKTGADFILTTEKDAVKLSSLLGDAPLRVLRVGMRISEEADFLALMEEKLFASR